MGIRILQGSGLKGVARFRGLGFIGLRVLIGFRGFGFTCSPQPYKIVEYICVVLCSL